MSYFVLPSVDTVIQLVGIVQQKEKKNCNKACSCTLSNGVVIFERKNLDEKNSTGKICIFVSAVECPFNL